LSAEAAAASGAEAAAAAKCTTPQAQGVIMHMVKEHASSHKHSTVAAAVLGLLPAASMTLSTHHIAAQQHAPCSMCLDRCGCSSHRGHSTATI
jgi:hypothetical protein